MKANIHPKYYPAGDLRRAGTTWVTGSTSPKSALTSASACHPFFTGEQRIVDTAGQVDRFVKRLEAKRVLNRRRASASRPLVTATEERKRKRRSIFVKPPLNHSAETVQPAPEGK